MNDFYVEVIPVIDYNRITSLCKCQYPLHRFGCPNFSVKKGCPPGTKNLDQVIDLSKTVYAIYNIFDYRGHINRMMEKHPHWSDRQAKCVLYWQPRVRKQLKVKIVKFMKEKEGYFIVKNPEALGTNLTETMKNAGIYLEWPPEKITYQIVLAGILKTHSI